MYLFAYNHDGNSLDVDYIYTYLYSMPQDMCANMHPLINVFVIHVFWNTTPFFTEVVWVHVSTCILCEYVYARILDI